MSIFPFALWFAAGFAVGIAVFPMTIWTLLIISINHADDEYMKDMEHERRL